MRSIAKVFWLYPALLIPTACAGFINEADKTLMAATLGKTSDNLYNSSLGIFDMNEESGTGGYYLQIPFYTALAVLTDQDDEDYQFHGTDYSSGDPYELTLPMAVSVGRVFPVNSSLWGYIGAGVGFTYITGAAATGTPGIVREYDTTGNSEFNVNAGAIWRFSDPVGLHINYDSAFNAPSFGIIFNDLFILEDLL